MDAPWVVSGASGFALGAHFWLKPDSPGPPKSFLSGVDTCCSDSGQRAPLTGPISTSACQKDDFDTSISGSWTSGLSTLRSSTSGLSTLRLLDLWLSTSGFRSLALDFPTLDFSTLDFSTLDFSTLDFSTLDLPNLHFRTSASQQVSIGGGGCLVWARVLDGLMAGV
ncbi:hypothetical protein KVT40_007722 [Elsinoe batatas]|uniref:Uncharacterized protein n=1 Tax=Elsinoe batatas TaxID=2601811 RepID=A0A8K0KZC1_9PEZI|nr:hypothetical protein KVT40_007722 [Elsinoe batatas]